MFVVICYDIIDDARRVKISKRLEDYGRRVQYSVFECIIDLERFKEMVKDILPIFDESEDSIRMYILCEKCIKQIEILGQGEIIKDIEDVLIV